MWQVVFVQAALAASVPHSDSLVEFLRELMGRSGRRVPDLRCLDLTEPIRLTSGQDRVRRMARGEPGGAFFQMQANPPLPSVTPVPVI